MDTMQLCMPQICMMTTKNLNFGGDKMEKRREVKRANQRPKKKKEYIYVVQDIKLCRLTHKQPFKIVYVQCTYELG